MRAAPPVSVRATGGPAWRAVRALLPALATGACGVWAAGHLEAPAWPAVPVAVAAGVLGWRRSLSAPVALEWDGQRWTAAGAPAQPVVAIDLGPWMLLRLAPAEASQSRPPLWLAVADGEAGSAWHALRCALYAAPQGAFDGAAG